MHIRYCYFFASLVLPISLTAAEKTDSKNQEPPALQSVAQFVGNAPAQPVATSTPTQAPKTNTQESDQKQQAAQQEKKALSEQGMIEQQSKDHAKALEDALGNLKRSLPQAWIPKIEKPKEQVTQIGFLSGLYDTAEFHSIPHEAYLRKHVESETLSIALSTSDSRRAKFGHAANELARKSKVRKAKDLTKRMGELVAWSNSYDIAMNGDDLALMRAATIERLNTCLATLTLIDAKKNNLVTQHGQQPPQ